MQQDHTDPSDTRSSEKFQTYSKTLKPAHFPTSTRCSLLSLKTQDRIIISAPTIIKADKQTSRQTILICLKQNPWAPRYLHSSTHPSAFLSLSRAAASKCLFLCSSCLLCFSWIFKKKKKKLMYWGHSVRFRKRWSVRTFQQYLAT